MEGAVSTFTQLSPNHYGSWHAINEICPAHFTSQTIPQSMLGKMWQTTFFFLLFQDGCAPTE